MAKTAKKKTKLRAVKKVVDGIKFDSTMEANYYEYLKEEKKKGNIKEIELQPKFLLLEDFKKYGRTIRKIEYISDFRVVYKDNTEKIIDVKGRETPDFKIKRKMFDMKYKDLTLQLIAHDTTLGWIDFDELKRINSKKKRDKKKANSIKN